MAKMRPLAPKCPCGTLAAGGPKAPTNEVCKCEPDEYRRIQCMDGRPTLLPVAGVARDACLARDVGQQPCDSALALIVDRAWHADCAAMDATRSECQDGLDREVSAAEGSFDGKPIDLGIEVRRLTAT